MKKKTQPKKNKKTLPSTAVQKRGLTLKEKVFISEYLKDQNGTRAYLVAFPTARYDSARNQAVVLLRRPRVAAFLKTEVKKVLDDLEITPERILKEFGRIAFQDPRRMFNQRGTLKKIHELDDNTAAAVSSFEVAVNDDGDIVKKIRNWSKTDALNTLAKWAKLLGDDSEKAGQSLTVIFGFSRNG